MGFRQLISAVLWCTALSFFLVVGSGYLLLALFISPRSLQPLARLACRGLLGSAGQRFRMSGTFPPLESGPYIYMFNHSSMLDTFVMMSVVPEFVGAVGKREQFEIPIWGHILRRWGAVPIDRHQLQDAIHRLGKVEEAVRGGLSLLIAPEGTRSPDGTLGALKKGPFHVAINTGAPIVPVAIRGAYHAKHKGSWLFRPGTIEVVVGAPLVSGAQSLDTVEGLRDAVAGSLEQMLGATQSTESA